jgi:hypothetical protein
MGPRPASYRFNWPKRLTAQRMFMTVLGPTCLASWPEQGAEMPAVLKIPRLINFGATKSWRGSPWTKNLHIASQVRLNHKASKTVSQEHYPKAEPGLGHPSYDSGKARFLYVLVHACGSRMKIAPAYMYQFSFVANRKRAIAEAIFSAMQGSMQVCKSDDVIGRCNERMYSFIPITTTLLITTQLRKAHSHKCECHSYR